MVSLTKRPIWHPVSVYMFHVKHEFDAQTIVGKDNEIGLPKNAYIYEMLLHHVNSYDNLCKIKLENMPK